MSFLFGGDFVSGITELAMLLKQRENNRDYSPMFGTVLDVENIKIRVGEKIILVESQIKSCVVLTEEDVGREVVLLPYANNQKFILIGVVQ